MKMDADTERLVARVVRASGDRFTTDADVRAYMQADEQRGMFGDDACVDKAQLNAWAEVIIASSWHMRLRCEITVDGVNAGAGYVVDSEIVDCPADLSDYAYCAIEDSMSDAGWRGAGSVEYEGVEYGWRIVR